MTTISAEAVLKSRNAADPCQSRCLSTVLCRYPRWIHAEGRTHRQLRLGEDLEVLIPTPSPMEDPMLSRNAASSRAIPVQKMIDSIYDDPAVPLFWGKNVGGMQAKEELSPRLAEKANSVWMQAMEDAIHAAKKMVWLDQEENGDKIGAHKQIVNRMLEPFMHITTLFSATEWQNFFDLRIHPDAEPHIKLLAERIKAAIEGTEAQVLSPGEWHTPFTGDWFKDGKGGALFDSMVAKGMTLAEITHNMKVMSTACCASTSYKTVEGFDMSLETATRIHDGLWANKHLSPMEHVARASEWEEAHQGPYGEWRTGRWLNSPQQGNFVGFTQYRHRP